MQDNYQSASLITDPKDFDEYVRLNNKADRNKYVFIASTVVVGVGVPASIINTFIKNKRKKEFEHKKNIKEAHQ